MECRKISDLMMKYIDKDINDVESEKLHAHLKCCSDCKMELEILESALHSVEALPELDLPYGFETIVMQSIKAQQKEKSMLFGIGVIGLVAFVCYIGIFFTLPLMKASGALDLLAYYISSGFAYAIGELLSGLITVILYIGKMFTLRDLLMNQYMGIVNIALVIAMLNIIIFRSIKYQHE